MRRITELTDKSNEIYTIHSFGFGQDHDSNMMSSIARLKDGNFYFVDKISSIDEAFVNALGAILSVAASRIEVQVDGFISKTFGEKAKLEGNMFKVELNQFITGTSKDYVFMLNLANLRTPSSYIVANARYKATTPQKTKLEKTAQLRIYIEPEDTDNTWNNDTSVLTEYMRVLAAESIKKAQALAEQRRYKEAK